MAKWGLVPEDYALEVVHVWPENWATVMFFDAIPFGAWSFSANGPTGIRPEAMREVRLARGVDLKRWREMFDDLQVMEAEALKTMYDERRQAGNG